MLEDALQQSTFTFVTAEPMLFNLCMLHHLVLITFILTKPSSDFVRTAVQYCSRQEATVARRGREVRWRWAQDIMSQTSSILIGPRFDVWLRLAQYNPSFKTIYGGKG